jgi:hypothetical protein
MGCKKGAVIKKAIKQHAPGAMVFGFVLLLMGVIVVGAILIVQNIETKLLLDRLAERQGRIEERLEQLTPKRDVDNMAWRFERMPWFSSIDAGVITLTIYRCALEHGLPPRLIEAMIVIESYRNPKAESHKGAKGLMQLMPCHLAEGEDPHDPILSIERGAAYFAQCLRECGNDFACALLRYNGSDPANPYKESIAYAEMVQGHWERFTR